jgi:phosphoribosylaminoimidazole-succinocarboxamide synthase
VRYRAAPRRFKAARRLLPTRVSVSFLATSHPAAEARTVSQAIVETELPFPLLRRGKVRDVYDLGDALLMVATDRVSAFDVVLPQPIPRKGEVLTLLSAWWFARTADLIPHHLLSVDADVISNRYPALDEWRDVWARRAALVRKLEPFPIECVVRGYLSGSAWKEYSSLGTLAGEPLPPGLEEAGRLEAPIFSPATKAEEGHDENITFTRMAAEIGTANAARLREASVALYERARQIAAESGIVIADTKFEFGRDADGTIMVMDEVLTPDSSRFWPAAEYAPGRGQPSLDKQPLRDYLESLAGRGEWNKQAPGPDLPDWLIAEMSRRYQEVFRRLTGQPLDEFPVASVGAA